MSGIKLSNYLRNSFPIPKVYSWSLSHWGSFHSVVVNMQNCNIIVNEFKLQSYDCIHFWTNTLGSSMNPLIPTPKLWVKIDPLSFYKDDFDIKYPMKVDIPLNKETITDPILSHELVWLLGREVWIVILLLDWLPTKVRNHYLLYNLI